MENLLTTTDDDPVLFPKHLPTRIRVEVTRASVSKKDPFKEISEGDNDSSQVLGRLKDFREAAILKAEEQYLRRLMPLTLGNINDACRMSGLSRPRLYALLKKYQVPKGT